MNLLKKSLLVTSLALTFGTVQAATYNIGNTNSVYLGFYSLDAAKDSSVLINLGSPNLLQPGYSLNMGDTSSALSLAFGADWYTQEDLFWSVIGRVTSSPSSNTAAYVGTGGDLLTVNAEGETNLSSVRWSQLNTRINGMLTYSGGVDADLSTITNSLGDVLQVSTAPNAGSSFKSYADADWSLFTVPVSIGVLSDLNIQEWTKSGTSYIDQTTMTTLTQSGGVISAVPEPSTYVLIGFGSLLLLIAYRRRSA